MLGGGGSGGWDSISQCIIITRILPSNLEASHTKQEYVCILVFKELYEGNKNKTM